MFANEIFESKIKEADLYRTQGLYKQSQKIYKDLLSMIEKDDSPQENVSFVQVINQKIKAVDHDLKEVDEATNTPELSEDTQKLISNLFSFSKNRHVAAIEGAVALAKFGQYDKALAEFQRLINNGILPMMVARNMLRCQLTLSSPDTAIDQLKKWTSNNIFSNTELNHLGEFLENLLTAEGIKFDYSTIMERSTEKEPIEGKMEEIFDIYSVRVRMDDGPMWGEVMDFDVTFQIGNTVSLIIKDRDKKIADSLIPGIKLPKIQCFSPISLLNCSGTVSNKSKITSGPKRGSHSLDILIEE